jgi:hypothetical protein
LKAKAKKTSISSSHNPNEIVNLSSYQLSEAEISVLRKGLGFCPTPNQPDISDLHTDTLGFIRKLRLAYHFHTYPEDQDETITDTQETRTESAFKPKSFWTPRPGFNHSILAKPVLQ